MYLLHYANWYKSIYELSALDRPDDTIINDDQQLDTWYDSYIREQAKTAAQISRQRNGPSDGRRWMSTDKFAAKQTFRPDQ